MKQEQITESGIEYTVITFSNGDQYWTLNNQLHRVDGPAINNGESQKWYYQDQLHRRGGPAWLEDDGTVSWWFKGKMHREDGPAVIFLNGKRHWYYHGKYVRVDSQSQFEEWLKFKAFA